MSAVLKSENNPARAKAFSMPLADIDVSNPELHRDDTVGHYFERLRSECPVHMGSSKRFGEFWSITRYEDIMKVDMNHQVFSSEPVITIRDLDVKYQRPSFISMDPPKHDVQRKTVSPIVAPGNLARMEAIIRERTQTVLDSLPRGEEFDWVEKVSIELTTQMLATLFDFPFEDRKLLTWWSDVAVANLEAGGPIDTDEKRMAELSKCLEYFTGLWNERVNEEPKFDLISMLAHSPDTRNMGPQEFLGNLILLIVGGNDTTRNSMSGSIVATNRFPDELAKVRNNPEIISKSFMPEVIRWQTPLSHMRRTAKSDTELNGQKIKAGDKVVMWYLSGNYDSDAIETPELFIADRARPRQHMSFGFGIHRCVGNRLAELQLGILWEEMLKRFEKVEMVGTPERTLSNFVHGWTKVPVIVR